MIGRLKYTNIGIYNLSHPHLIITFTIFSNQSAIYSVFYKWPTEQLIKQIIVGGGIMIIQPSLLGSPLFTTNSLYNISKYNTSLK